MLPDEQIERALAKIAKLDGAVSQDLDDLIALAADYECQREEIERLKRELAQIEKSLTGPFDGFTDYPIDSLAFKINRLRVKRAFAEQNLDKLQQEAK